MKLYFAPMEGATGYIYRNNHHLCFGQVDRYFTPFIVPNQNHKFTSREFNDILPEHNEGIPLIPQLMTNKAADFIWAAGELKRLGYGEVNLNLGCPSGTVVSKGKGSGFLAKLKELDLFLQEVCEAVDRLGMKFSVKTRIGLNDRNEWQEIMEVYNHHSLEELIIHPRLRKDMYRNRPDMEAFDEGVRTSRNEVCYNGDIFTLKDYEEFVKTYPKITSVMMGRGLLANPGLGGEIRKGTAPDIEVLKKFHDKIYEDYRSIISGERNVLFKMKEIWSYEINIFSDSEKYWKKIKKSDHLPEYEAAVRNLFAERNLLTGEGYRG